jgi:hypothetical protein
VKGNGEEEPEGGKRKVGMMDGKRGGKREEEEGTRGVKGGKELCRGKEGGRREKLNGGGKREEWKGRRKKG